MDESNKVSPLVARLKTGVPSSYNMEKHVTLLEKVFANYGGVGAFCDEAGISKPTFYEWISHNPEFKEAYEILLNRGERMWEKLLLTRPDLPMSCWQTIWRNRFNQGRRRIEKPEKDGLGSELEALDNHLYDGHLTIDEHSKGIASLEKKAKVKQLDHILAGLLGTGDHERIKRMGVEELEKELNEVIHNLIHPHYKIVAVDPSDES